MKVISVVALMREWHGRQREEFLDAHPKPVLVGLGAVNARLLHDPRRLSATPVIGVDLVPGEREEVSSSLAGAVITVVGRGEGEPERIVVGRASLADIVVDDPSVSERHCVIERRGERYMVRDLGSTNGTLVNGDPLEVPLSHSLRDEDVLTVGRYSFQFFTPAVLHSYLQLSAAVR